MTQRAPAVSTGAPAPAAAPPPVPAAPASSTPAEAPGWQPKATQAAVSAFFDPQRRDYNPTTALAMAEMSKLVYVKWDGDAKLGQAMTNRLKTWGFDEPTRFNSQGAQGIITSNKDCIVVSFRGTEFQKLEDLVYDVNASRTRQGYGEIHTGFNDALQAIWPKMSAELTRLQGQSQRPVFLTGHSLGGAMAVLAAHDLARHGAPAAGVYTYGSPKVGNQTFVDEYDRMLGDRTFRLVKRNDPVPNSPTLLGYQPGDGWANVAQKAERYLDGDGALSRGANRLDTLWDRLKGHATNLFSGDLFKRGPSAFVDHDVSSYVTDLKQLKR